jgi:hypothetical protein
MNLTVGPLPPAVYWRRRAIVLGGLLLVVLLVAYACSGPSNSSASGRQSTGPSLPSTGSSSVAPSTVDSSAPVDEFPPPSTPVSSSPSPTVPPSPTLSPTGITTCTDDQIKVTPVITSTSPTSSKLVHGGTFDLKLKIRNVSTVTCRRDVGSVPEELFITNASDAEIWSSDACAKAGGKTHDVRTFAPDIEIYAEVQWSSYNIADGGCAKSPTPAPVGTYTLTGRVGTASSTVPFTISD